MIKQKKKVERANVITTTKKGTTILSVTFWKKKTNKGEPPNEGTQSMAKISLLNMMDEDFSWWVDTRATKHVCKNKEFFKKFLVMNDSNVVVYIGNASTTPILGTEK